MRGDYSEKFCLLFRGLPPHAISQKKVKEILCIVLPPQSLLFVEASIGSGAITRRYTCPARRPIMSTCANWNPRAGSTCSPISCHSSHRSQRHMEQSSNLITRWDEICLLPV